MLKAPWSARRCLKLTISPRRTCTIVVLLLTLGIGCSAPQKKSIQPVTVSPTVYRDIPYEANERQKLDLYIPTSPLPNQPIVVFFYGGGWRTGDKKDYAFFGKTLSEHGILTAIANYRLYPDTTFPGFIDDGADAVAWVSKHAEAYGGNPRRIFLMGHSTGAYIAAMLAFDPDFLQRDGVSSSSIAGVIGLAGIYDFSTASNRESVQIFRGGTLEKSADPLDYVSDKAPPALLLVGGNDVITSPDYDQAFAKGIKTRGGKVQAIVYPAVGHVGIMLPFSSITHNNTIVVDNVLSFVSIPGSP